MQQLISNIANKQSKISIQKSQQFMQEETSWPEQQNYEVWLIENGFDPKFGYLICPEHEISYFNRGPLDEIFGSLHNLIETGEIVEKAKTMKCLELKTQEDFENEIGRLKYEKDLFYLHCALSTIIQAYIKVQRGQHIPNEQIIIPYNLAKPFVQVSKILDIKTGQTSVMPMQWILSQEQLSQYSNLSILDIGLKFRFLPNEITEKLFFGASIYSSYCLFQILREIVAINSLISKSSETSHEIEIKLKLQKIAEIWSYIVRENQRVSMQLDGDAFYNNLRLFLKQFKQIKFEGFEKGFDGSGGNAGYDPMFQIFERAMGINYKEQSLVEIQDKFVEEGMIKKHRLLIDKMRQYSQIRNYCEKNQDQELKQSYNKILRECQKFNRTHNAYMNKFILQFTPKEKHNSITGVSGAPISIMLLKAKQISNLYLEIV